jgi:hypothetical protein
MARSCIGLYQRIEERVIMPLGTECNRTDLNKTGISYKDGDPITIPHEFGTPVNLPHDFGNDIPSSGTNENDVTWLPSSEHFGNVFNLGPLVTSGFELEDSSGVILLESGDILLLEIQ